MRDLIMRNKGAIFAAVMLLVTILSPVCRAADDISVYVDRELVWFQDQKPFINSESRTMVPVRFVSEYLGAAVDWNAGSSRVDLAYQGKKIALTVGQKEALVDGGPVALDTKAVLTNGRTMVPLRFISECLGAAVQWDGDKREVHVHSKGYAADLALIDSDLALGTPPPGRNLYGVNLAVGVVYKYTTPVEPQLVDLREILETRFGEKAAPIVDYVASKKSTAVMLPSKEWDIDGKHIRVGDSSGFVSVIVWN